MYWLSVLTISCSTKASPSASDLPGCRESSRAPHRWPWAGMAAMRSPWHEAVTLHSVPQPTFIMVQDELGSEIHTDTHLVHSTRKYLPWLIRASKCSLECEWCFLTLLLFILKGVHCLLEINFYTLKDNIGFKNAKLGKKSKFSRIEIWFGMILVNSKS